MADCKFILLPGLDGTGLLFKPFQEAFLDQNLEVVSYPTDKKLDYNQLAELVKEQLPKTGKFILIAESFSGPVAARLLGSPRLKAVIFCATFLNPPRPLLLKIFNFLKASYLLKIDCPSFFIKYFCLEKASDEELVALLKKAIRKVSPEVIDYRFKLMSKLEDLKLISSSKTPVLCLAPKGDKLVPKHFSFEIKQTAEFGELEEIKGPHFILQAAPSEAAKIIKDFIDSA